MIINAFNSSNFIPKRKVRKKNYHKTTDGKAEKHEFPQMNCQTSLLCFETFPKVFMWENKPIFMGWLILFLEEGSSSTNLVKKIPPTGKENNSKIQNYCII